MYWYTTYGRVVVEEQVFRLKETGKRIRPFLEAAGVKCRGYSKLLRRVISDFGADNAFGQVPKKLKEHYGISVPISAAADITESHAREIYMKDTTKYKHEQKEQKEEEVIIAESDGSMVPIVETGIERNTKPDENKQVKEIKTDKRKVRRYIYCEARLSLAHGRGKISPVFAGTFGSVAKAGKQLLHCVEEVGINRKTKIHCVGDGAKWIANQVEEQFGSNGKYLIDFYHLCEYLSEAATICAPSKEKIWMETQKERLKTNQSQYVLTELSKHIKTIDEKTPVHNCYRYMKNRLEQLDYKTAIEERLPIGSGEIESAHRYIIQKRLKTAGAWWKKNNAEYMLAMRICRANDEWDNYWNRIAA